MGPTISNNIFVFVNNCFPHTHARTHTHTQTGLVDFSTVDVLLISNCFSMLSLPFLTEVTYGNTFHPSFLKFTSKIAMKLNLVVYFYFQKLGFKGRIYATEPTMHFGR